MNRRRPDRKLERLALKTLSAAMKARWRNVRPYNVPEWCPPEFAAMYEDTMRACACDTPAVRRIVEAHIAKVRKI